MKQSQYAKMYRLRKDGRWEGSYKDTDGKWHNLSDKDPSRLHEKIENAKKPRSITFADAAGAWEAIYRESCNVRTWTNYKPHYTDIVDKYGEYAITEIQGLHIIQDLQRAKAQGYSRTIVNTRRTLFNNILNHAVAKGWIPWNPAIGVKLPKGLPSSTRSAPSDEQINTIIQNRNLPFGMFAFLCLCTGLRKGEALALLKSDIHGSDISVTKSLTFLDGSNPKVKEPKSASGVRSVPIVSILKGPLDAYIKQLNGDILFPNRSYNRSPGNTYMTQSNYDTAWEAFCRESGLAVLTAHQLRHGTATLLYEAGVDVHTARKILGHAKVETTMGIYTELREKHEKQSVQKLDTYLNALVSKKSDSNTLAK